MRFPLLLLMHPHIIYATITNRAPQFPPLPTPPPPHQPLKDNPSCQLVGEALAICGSLTPAFKDMPATSQAQCLCYSSTIWAPSIFDSAVKYCADFASTASNTAFSALSNLQGFCTNVGDVLDKPATNSNAATTTSGYGAIPPPCGMMNSLMSECAAKTQGFATMDPKSQAKCLCYQDNGPWAPASFDNAVSACCQAAQTQAPGLYTAAAALEGFCASVGDINTATLSSYSFAAPAPSPSPTSTNANAEPTTTNHIDKTITIAQPAQTGKAPITKVTQVEVVLVSGVCAAVLGFLY